jgi:hypothetical protein
MCLKNKSAVALLGLVLSIHVMANPVVLAGIKLEETIVLQNWHDSHGERQCSGRAVQGRGVLQRVDGHLVGPEPHGLGT